MKVFFKKLFIQVFAVVISTVLVGGFIYWLV